MAAPDLGPYLHQEHVHMSTLPLSSRETKLLWDSYQIPALLTGFLEDFYF